MAVIPMIMGPGMFMPTNGSAGDALIRLPEPFRQDAQGREDPAIYRINLAIVEAFIRRVDVPIDKTDERALGSDLDGNGVLGALAVPAGVVGQPSRLGCRAGGSLGVGFALRRTGKQ